MSFFRSRSTTRAPTRPQLLWRWRRGRRTRWRTCGGTRSTSTSTSTGSGSSPRVSSPWRGAYFDRLTLILALKMQHAKYNLFYILQPRRPQHQYLPEDRRHEEEQAEQRQRQRHLRFERSPVSLRINLKFFQCSRTFTLITPFWVFWHFGWLWCKPAFNIL